MNHFWHAGHLNIAGLKMSKSLKNFITIRDVLRKYSGRTVRFLFLLTPWDTTMNFSDDSLKAATTKEKEFNEFFANNAIAVRARPSVGGHAQLWNDEDRKLHAKLVAVREGAHKALCDNFDFVRVMALLSELVADTNRYRQLVDPSGAATYKSLLLSQVSRYVDSLMRVFGVVPDPEPGFVAAGADDKKLAGVLDAVALFRDAMRDAARAKKTPQEVLALCDKFRDEALIEVGVRMEDVTVAAPVGASQGGNGAGSVRSVWKLDDPEKLKKERDDKRREETSLRLAKARNKLDKAVKDLAKLADAATSPRDFFAAQKDKFAAFDAEGRPTHDQENKELSKSGAKNVAKAWDTRDKAHKEYQAKTEKNPDLLAQIKAEQEELAAEVQKLEQLVKEQA